MICYQQYLHICLICVGFNLYSLSPSSLKLRRRGFSENCLYDLTTSDQVDLAIELSSRLLT
ncbi:hypothetical protein Tsubulata_004774 [Turnera subulata]|uniref:Uncharacterized protein n=1 Tax=Turnera subulata TaxID=218843 RepID=A0A9Q0FB92_9ROSI|nr:hypothetical protein Tsubulata_004774 [Turnera subulata]